MSDFTVLSPAKLNLNLRVLGSRKDGLHDIESVVQTVNIFDEVHIRLKKQGGVSLRANALNTPPEKNTAFAAAELFLKEAGITDGVEISLEKNIPAGSGLGGGSGNAAAVLAGLNRVFRVFSEESLRRIGGKVGADVPLFINCRACRISGAGEKAEPLNGFPLLSYVVFVPPVVSRTADVYRRWDDLPPFKSRNGRKFWNITPRTEMINDLEPAAFSLHPKLVLFHDMIDSAFNIPFLMTGSGSAFFSVFEDENEAQAVFDRAGKAGNFKCFFARAIEGWREKTGARFSPGL